MEKYFGGIHNMIENSYKSLAENEYLYMKASIEIARQLKNYNVLATQCAQICEKYLKAIVSEKLIMDATNKELLQTHNLRSILSKIKEYYDLQISSREIKYVGDFYFDARYPGDNFTTVDEEAIEDCIEITQKVREECLKILEQSPISPSLDLPPASDIK